MRKPGPTLILMAMLAWGAAPAGAAPPTPFSFDLLSLSDVAESEPVVRSNRSVAEGTWLRLRGFGVYSEAEGQADFDDPLAEALGFNTDIDLEDTLGMDLNKFTGGGLIGISWGSNKQFHLDFTFQGYYDYEGNRDVGSISFNGETFVGQVASIAKLAEGDIDLRWDVWKPESVDLTWSLELGANLYFIEAELQGETTGNTSEVSFVAPVPVLGTGLRWGITPNIYVQGGVAGIYAGEYASYIDASAEVGYDFNRNFGMFVGFRYYAMDLEWDGDDYHVDNQAIYAGVEVRL